MYNAFVIALPLRLVALGFPDYITVPLQPHTIELHSLERSRHHDYDAFILNVDLAFCSSIRAGIRSYASFRSCFMDPVKPRFWAGFFVSLI